MTRADGIFTGGERVLDLLALRSRGLSNHYCVADPGNAALEDRRRSAVLSWTNAKPDQEASVRRLDLLAGIILLQQLLLVVQLHRVGQGTPP